MLTAIAGILAAAAKILPTLAKLGDLLYEAYSASRKDRNQTQTDSMAGRDAAAIAAAGVGLPALCATCPFAGGSARRDNPAPAAPGISGGSQGGA